MAQLIIRNVEDTLVLALKQQAARHGRSVEAEHQDILRQALLGAEQAEAFKEWLTSMPDGACDEDFARVDDLPRDVDL